MPTAAMRVCVWILGILIVISAAVAALALMHNKTLQVQNQSLHDQIVNDESTLAELTTKAQKLQDEATQLNNELSQAQQKNAQTQSLYDDLKHTSDDLQANLKQVKVDRNDLRSKLARADADRNNLRLKLARANTDRNNLKITLARINTDRDDLKAKLVQVEADWKNKIGTMRRERDNLMQKLKDLSAQSVPVASNNGPAPSQDTSASSSSMELQPIIVNTANQQPQVPPQAGQALPQAEQAPPAEQVPPQVPQAAPAPAGVGKSEGSILIINELHNFVVVNLGQENSSVSVGSPLKVYRNLNEIADLKVIQVRRDICAASIQDKSTELKVGDIVEFNPN